MRILGIDPGSNATGYGVVERRGARVLHVAHGTLRPPAGASFAVRLAFLHRAVGEVIEQHAPEIAVVERVFVYRSPRAALALGQARGAVLCALAGAGLSVCEYSAAEAKQAVTGSGAAGKDQVRTMVRRLLALDRAPAPDAADALAVAIRHAHGGPLEALGVAATRRRRRSARPPIRVRWAR